ncbi:response regulator [Paenibacillus tarimensis]
MKVILIDDEILALNYLENQLAKIAAVEVLGKYSDPFEGKEKLLQEEVDVAFLDINLPEINGIELAEQILEIKPNIHVVFVSAYDDHAIKAFELNALDYLLKPVGAERLTKTLNRIQDRVLESANIPQRLQPIHMKLFRQLSVESFAPMRWRTAKAQELFLYLVQHRGQLVRKSALAELLWPEYEPGRAYPQLYTAIYHIRKKLKPFGKHFKILSTTDGYVLSMENVLLDVEELENYIHTGPPVTAETIDAYVKRVLLYTGDYLQEYEYWWAESERQRLKMLWLSASLQIAEWYSLNRQLEKAVAMYNEICARHPIAEEVHFALMKLFADSNNYGAVHRQYRILADALQEELNEQPSPYITEWYHKLSCEYKV